MRGFATVLLVSVWCAVGMFALASDALAQGVSLEMAVGYDQLANDLGYEDLVSGEATEGGLGIDGRLAFSVDERWELGAAFSLKRATMSLLRRFFCPDIPVDCPPPPDTIWSKDYTEVVSALATARFWPMGVVDRSRTVRPLVGLHAGFLWYNNGLELVERESVGTTINHGVPIGFDAGVGVAISDRTYLLTYLTGQMLLVDVPRRPYFHVNRSTDQRVLEADGFGFRWGIRTGIGFRL